MTTELKDINLLDLDIFLSGPPHHLFRVLRQQAPIYWHPDPAGGGFWVLTKYEDLVKVSMDTATFSSAKGFTLEAISSPNEFPMMATTDPPRHTKLRRLVSTGFTPRMVNRLEPDVRQIVNQLLDNAIAKGECDFVTEVAAELPLRIIARFLGVPDEDVHRLFHWSNSLIGALDPEYSRAASEGAEGETPEALARRGEEFRRRSEQTVMEMASYLYRLEEERRREPRQDLVTTFLYAEVDGEKLSDLERFAQFVLLSVAGNETTRNLISGGLLALMEHPDQLELLRNDLSLVPTAVEEMLRYVSPVMYMARCVTRDTEFKGVTMKAGDRVTMWYVSANRDEDVFPDPDAFIVTRQPNDHVAFGAGGPHFCLGAPLARLEARVMFEELLTRPYDVELAGRVEWLRSNFVSGIKHIPVRFRRRSR
ncbi:MAG TPA: cytochrome P450 [Dehalococcoidia bacterium]|nr:cytochrome P450 [Dehalococcoidia bacterium]